MVRKIWSRHVLLNWKFGLLLLLLICVPRFYLVLNANKIGNYSAIGIIMFVSFLIPFIFLNPQGLWTIGWRKPSNYFDLGVAFVKGLLFAFFLYFIGYFLFNDSIENWYIYIGKSYNIPSDLSMNDKTSLFLMMAATGMLFSPFGEEMYFRGIVHECFANSFGNSTASRIDSAAFALTHLAHFGIIYWQGTWQFLPVPSLLWIAAMYAASRLFYISKVKTDSIFGAVASHAAFNFMMIYCIFYLL